MGTVRLAKGHQLAAQETRLRTGWARPALTLLCTPLLLLAGCSQPAAGLNGATADNPDELQRRALDLLVRAANTAAPETRCNAIEALARVAPGAGVPAFRGALKHDAGIVRYAGCLAIGEVRDTQSLEQVLRLLRDKEPRVRLGAAFAAYRCGEQRQAQLLVQTLGQSQEELLRADAAFLIGRLGEKAAQRWLRFAAMRDKSSRVAMTAYGALAALGDSDAVDRLIEYSQGAVETRVLALLTLADLRADRARDALRYRLAQRSDYIQTRLLAARALGRLGDKSGFDLALDATRQTGRDELETYYIRSAAAHALGAIGDRRALPALQRLASGGNEQVQVAACYAILEILGTPAQAAS